MRSHVSLLVVLAVGIAVTAYIGFTGHFKLFNEKGLLSGPFSALLLLGAAEMAALALVLLDWRIWAPRAVARERELECWLAADLLGGATPNPGWETIRGQFRGRAVSIQRSLGAGIGTWRWTMPARFDGSFAIVRLKQPVKAEAGIAEVSTGDAEFEARYAWQSDRPATWVALLRDEGMRTAVKRLTSLFALHGRVGDANCGLRLSGNELTLIQIPAPALLRPGFNPDEWLLILHDLSTVAAMLEQAPLAKSEAVSDAAEPGGAWLALGCLGLFALGAWIGIVYLVAIYAGLPGAMIAFFMPAVALALWFMFVSARGSGRDPEVDSAIDREAGAEVGRYGDLSLIRTRLVGQRR